MKGPSCITRYTHCTIGIPAYNEAKALPAMLTSLERQVLPDKWIFHVVVVANGCTDNTVQIALNFGSSAWGTPQVSQTQVGQWWHFYRDPHRFSVCKVPIAKKSHAINIIHNSTTSGIVLLFDADVQLDPNVVKAMCKAFSEYPNHGAVATNYQGQISPMDMSNGWFFEVCRIYVSKAINNFDQHRVRLDGKGYGYRRHLINEHPSLITVDTWLEGIAWQCSAGCIYLSDTYVKYQFPQSFQEFVIQYARYARTTRAFARKYPEIMVYIQQGRSLWHSSGRQPSLTFRMIGWMFFRLVDFYTKISRGQEDNEKWKVIQSTKHRK